MSKSRGAPPRVVSPVGPGGAGAHWLRNGALAVVMFLVATVSPAITGIAPAATAAPVVSGTGCSWTTVTPDSMTGSTWIQAGGLPGALSPGTDRGSSKVAGATFSFRYTKGSDRAAAAVGPWSSWITVTSGTGGDYCVTGLEGFHPTTAEILGSYVQFSAADQTLESALHVPSSMPGQGRAVQASIDPDNDQWINMNVGMVNNRVSAANVQFMRAQTTATPLGSSSRRDDCRVRVGTVTHTTDCFTASGRVGLEQAGSPELHSSGDSGAAGVTVCLSPEGAPSIVRCAVTDSAGNYEINLLSSDAWVHGGSEPTSLNGNTDEFTMWVVPPPGYRPSVSSPFAQGVDYSLAAGSGALVAPLVVNGNRVTQSGSTPSVQWTFAVVHSNDETLSVPPAACPAPTTIGVTVGNLVGGATYQLRVGSTLYPVTGPGVVTIPTPTSAAQIELLRTTGAVKAVPVSANYSPEACPPLADLHDPGYLPISTMPGVEASVSQTQDTTMPPGTVATIDTATVPAGWSVSVDPVTHVVKATPPANAVPGAVGDIGVVFTFSDGSVDTAVLPVTVEAIPTPTVTTTVTSTAVTTEVTTSVVTTTAPVVTATTTETATTTATSVVPTTVTSTEPAVTETVTAEPTTVTDTVTVTAEPSTSTETATVTADPETSTVTSVTTATVTSIQVSTSTETSTAVVTETVTSTDTATTTAVETTTVTESAVTQILQPTTFTAVPTTTYTTSIAFPNTTVDVSVPPVTAPVTTTVLVTDVDSDTTRVTAAPVVIAPPGEAGTGSLSGGSIGSIVEGSLGDDGSSGGGSLESVLAVVIGSLGLPFGSMAGSLGSDAPGSLAGNSLESIEGTLGSSGGSGSGEGALGSLADALGSNGDSGLLGSLAESLGSDSGGSVELVPGSEGGAGSATPIPAMSVGDLGVGSLAVGSLGLTVVMVGGVLYAVDNGLFPLPPGIRLPLTALPPLPPLGGVSAGSLGMVGASTEAAAPAGPPSAPGPDVANGRG